MERPSGTYNVNYSQDMAIVRTRTQWGLLIAGLITLFALPCFASSYWLSFINIAAITLIAVLGLNILTGYCGQISLGQAAFMGVGAYTSAFLCNYWGLSFWTAFPCAVLATGLVGIIFGLPALRLKGFYLTMSTLAAQFLLVWCFGHIKPDILGGLVGISLPYPSIGDFIFDSEQSMFYIIVSLAVVMTFFAKNLVRTRVGRAFIAIRDNDLAAEVMGINPFYYKLLAFFICSLYAGVAGSLWGHYVRFIDPEHFTLMDSIWYMGIAIVGGLGSTAGAVFGTIFMRGLDLIVTRISPVLSAIFPEIAGSMFAALSQMFFGLVIILFLIFESRGLAHRWEVFKASYRIYPYPY